MRKSLHIHGPKRRNRSFSYLGNWSPKSLTSKFFSKSSHHYRNFYQIFSSLSKFSQYLNSNKISNPSKRNPNFAVRTRARSNSLRFPSPNSLIFIPSGRVQLNKGTLIWITNPFSLANEVLDIHNFITNKSKQEREDLRTPLV